MHTIEHLNGFTQITHTDGDCSVLIHDGGRVITLFRCSGTTKTPLQVFVGTEEKCLAEIDRLGLLYEPSDETSQYPDRPPDSQEPYTPDIL